MSPEVGLALQLAVVTALVVVGGIIHAYKRGVAKGRNKESMRVQDILYATTSVVVGGTTKAVWDCINGHISREQMNSKIVYTHARKEAMRAKLEELGLLDEVLSSVPEPTAHRSEFAPATSDPDDEDDGVVEARTPVP